MKKIFAWSLALALVISLCVCAFAEGFVSSPSGKSLPTMTITSSDPGVVITPIKGADGEVTVMIIEKDGCSDALIITPYSAKNGMPTNVVDGQIEDNTALATENKEQMEAAFEQLSGLKSFAELPGIKASFSSDLAAAAVKAGTTIDKLVVSDLFDISYYHISQTNSGHTDAAHEDIYNIAVGDDLINSFVALLQQPKANNPTMGWEIVDTTLNYATKTISFKIDVDDLSPYALVVFPNGSGDHGHGGTVVSPKTADPMSLMTAGAALMASVSGLAVLGKRKHI